VVLIQSILGHNFTAVGYDIHLMKKPKVNYPTAKISARRQKREVRLAEALRANLKRRKKRLAPDQGKGRG